MKTRAIPVAGLVALGAIAAAQVPHSRDEGEAGRFERLKREVRQLSLDISETKGIIVGLKDREIRDRLSKNIARMEQRCNLIDKELGRFQLPQAEAVFPIDDAELKTFMDALRGMGFDDKKIPAMKEFVQFHHFTCAQATQLVKCLSFSKGQVEAAVMLRPRVVDPQNFYQVLGALTFESDREKVRKTLNMK